MKRTTRHFLRALPALAVSGALVFASTGCSPAANDGGEGGTDGASDEQVTVNVRLWDETIKPAYEASFEQFESKNPDINVEVTQVPWANYFDKLRADASAGNAGDIFWLNGANYLSYAESGNIMDIGTEFEDLKGGWVSSVVDQYSSDGKLWGVPQLTDGGIAVYYNQDLLKKAGLSTEDLQDLEWNPDNPEEDTFLKTVQKLTLDNQGHTAADPAFDPKNVVQYGYNASQDLQAIYYNFGGSNGGTFQEGDEFTFSDPQTVEAMAYVVDLINKYHVSPPASTSNNNGDYLRNQFLQGKIALFQSGLYNLKNVASDAKFEWALAPMPAGPEGRVSVAPGVIAAGNAKSEHPEETKKVLQWLGSDEGAKPIGAQGAALPAVEGAQGSFLDYWESQGVDPTAFAEAASGKVIPAPTGANYAAAQTAFKPIFDEIFEGRTPVKEGLEKAEEAANQAIGE